MDLSEPPKRRRTESIVPMINVVFLLLIFFLMSARIAPPDPFEVAPPRADGFEGGPLDPAAALFLGAEGDVGFGAARGEEIGRAHV